MAIVLHRVDTLLKDRQYKVKGTNIVFEGTSDGWVAQSDRLDITELQWLQTTGLDCMAIPTLKEVRSFLADQVPPPTGYGNSYTLHIDGLYAKHCLYAHAAADGSSKTYDLVGPWSGRSFHIVKQQQGYACYTERLFGAEDHIVCNTPTLRDAVVLIDKKYGPKSIRYRCRRLFRQYCVPVGTRSI